MSLSPPSPASSRASFWQTATYAGPPAIFVGVIVLVAVLGGYQNFQWVGKEVTPLEAFGILGPMLLPMAFFFHARQKHDTAMAEVSTTWPVAPGEVQARWC